MILQNRVLFLIPCLWSLCSFPCSLSAKIVEGKKRVEFIRSAPSKKSDQESSDRFSSFERKEASLACQAPSYSLESKQQYTSLYNFIEVSQRTDFKVSPQKDFAVVWSVSCQRPCAGAESLWNCTLHATTVDQDGHALGDMGGDFEEVLFHHYEPYVFLVRHGCCGMPYYAEVYDLHGKLRKKIHDYQDSFLEKPFSKPFRKTHSPKG